MDADTAGPQPRNPATEAFLRGMRELGYVYGEHFVTEPRGSAGEPERFPQLGRRDGWTAGGRDRRGGHCNARGQTGHLDHPHRHGGCQRPRGLRVRAEPRTTPGGNITGLAVQAIETTGKRLEMLRELIPPSATVAVLWDQGQLGVLAGQPRLPPALGGGSCCR